MRSWAGLAAVGAGLVHLGVAAAAPPVLLALLSAAGAVEVLWGVVALARTRTPAPRAALGAALGLVVAGGGAGVLPALVHHHAAAGASTPVLPVGAMLGAAVMDLGVAVVAAVGLRSGRVAAGPLTARNLPALLAGAVVVAAITTTSLTGTAVGLHHVH